MKRNRFDVQVVEEEGNLVPDPVPNPPSAPQFHITHLFGDEGASSGNAMFNFLKSFYAPEPAAREKDEQNVGKKAGLGVIIGVFLPNIQNVFGILMFLRLYWVVGMAGVVEAFIIVLMCCMCTFLTSISVSAVATNGVMQAGGPYFIISRNLGPGIGAGVGLLFFMANAVATAMYLAGAVEILLKYVAPSMVIFQLTDVIIDIENNIRVYGTILLIILFAVTSLGVKWVQLLAPLSLLGVLVSIVCIYAGMIAASVQEHSTICVFDNKLLRYPMWNNESTSFCHNEMDGSLYGCFCGFSNLSDPSDAATAVPQDHWSKATTDACEKRRREEGEEALCKKIKEPGSLEERAAFPGSGVISKAAKSHYGDKEENDDLFVFQDFQTGFFILLAIYFPSVTGIMTGCNMSGDLKNPQRDIPRGTIAAQLFTSFVYLSLVLIFGGCIDPLLLQDRYGDAMNGGCDKHGNPRGGGMIIADFAWPRTQWIVVIGSFTSTIGAAIQSLVSAPRLLQAVARDEIVPIIRWFGVLNFLNEPWRALVLTVFIAEIFVLIGTVDHIAQVLGYFFLMCYFFVNVSCAVQSIVNAPNWRPRFKWYHWSLSLAGAILSLIIMLFANWMYCLAVFVAWGLIYFYVNYRGAKKEWGSGLKGLTLTVAQQCLLWYQDDEVHTKNWRPEFAVLMKPADIVDLKVHPRPKLPIVKDQCKDMLHFVDQLRSGQGLAVAVSVLYGSVTERRNWKDAEYVKNALKEALRLLKLKGFADVAVDENNGSGMGMMIQSLGIGGLRPNVLVLSWPTAWQKDNLQDVIGSKEREIVVLQQCFQQAACGKMALMLVKGVSEFPKGPEKVMDPIDVWWIMEDGGLLLLLPYLLKKNVLYSKCRLRVFAIAGEGDDPLAMKIKLEKWCWDLRIDAEVHVEDGLTEESIEEFVQQRTLQLKRRVSLARELKVMGREAAKDPQLLRDSCNAKQGGELEIEAPEILSPKTPKPSSPSALPSTKSHEATSPKSPTVTQQPKSPLNVVPKVAGVQPTESPMKSPPEKEVDLARVASPTSISSIDGVVKEMRPTAVQSELTARSQDNLDSELSRASMNGTERSLADEKIRGAVQLNHLIRSKSSGAKLVILNSPKIPTSKKSFVHYMEYVNALTHDIDRLLLVKGTGKQIITIYS